jgi:hypothetical protein
MLDRSDHHVVLIDDSFDNEGYALLGKDAVQVSFQLLGDR